MKTYRRRRHEGGISKNDDQDPSSTRPVADLPDAIVVEIFFRLPITDVIQCRSVCKEWYKVLSDSHFMNEYLRNPPFTTLLIYGYKRSIPLLFFLHISKEGGCIQESRNYNLSATNLFDSRKSFARIIGACNGLLGIHVYEKAYFINPLSGDCIAELPAYEKTLLYKQYGDYRFGFSSSIKKFKVVRNVGIRDLGGDTVERCDIFTIGVDKSWRRINMAYPFYIPFRAYNDAFCNGAIHWTICTVHQNIYTYSIFAFDLDKEECRRIAYPPDRLSPSMNLTLWNNHLCLYSDFPYLTITIWTMKEYGVAESWSKDLILKSLGPQDLPWMFIPDYTNIITKLPNGDILISSDCERFFSYNDTKKKCSVVTILDDEELQIYSALNYSSSFFSFRKHTVPAYMSCSEHDS